MSGNYWKEDRDSLVTRLELTIEQRDALRQQVADLTAAQERAVAVLDELLDDCDRDTSRFYHAALRVAQKRVGAALAQLESETTT